MQNELVKKYRLGLFFTSIRNSFQKVYNMIPGKTLVYFVALIFLTGCVQAEQIGTAMKYHVQGRHYIQTRNYDKGEALFRQAVKESPASAQANYYFGRFLLAEKKEKKALSYLEKAVSLDSDDVDYNFWLGVAYGVNGYRKKERKSYKKALALQPKHPQSLIYLGHSQLKSKEHQSALTSYEKALKIWPASPSALYNRALIMNILGRTPEEKLAWLEYMSLYPSGGLARRATDHLNMLSNFSYRNHTLAARTITLTKINFKPFKAKLDSSSYPSLKLVGATVSNMDKGTLQVVVYQKNNKTLARKRAVSIKKYLQETFPDLRGKRIGISWFSEAEKFKIAGKKLRSDESVRFFLTGWNLNT